MRTKISIITVTYNSEKTVEQTIKSVLSQTYRNFEYIIVDGSSNDRTVSIIKKNEESDKRIKYISEPDNGIYDAMNKGIKMASGDFIALLNSDDYYEPDALENIVKNIPENFQNQMLVIYGMVRYIENETESMVLIKNHKGLPERMLMHPACFVSRDIYKMYKYDTNYKSAADYDLFLKLYQNPKVIFIPIYKIITNFRLGGMSSSLVSYLESNDIRYKYGYLSKRQHLIGNMGLIIKRKLMGQ